MGLSDYDNWLESPYQDEPEWPCPECGEMYYSKEAALECCGYYDEAEDSLNDEDEES